MHNMTTNQSLSQIQRKLVEMYARRPSVKNSVAKEACGNVLSLSLSLSLYTRYLRIPFAKDSTGKLARGNLGCIPSAAFCFGTSLSFKNFSGQYFFLSEERVAPVRRRRLKE